MPAEPLARLTPTVSGLPFQTEAAALEWLQEHGIEHLARLSFWALAPRVESPFLPQLHASSSRRRLVELVSEESFARWVAEAKPSARMKEHLPRLALEFLESEREAAEEARASLSERTAPPEDARTHRVHGLLMELRSRIPSSIAPRTTRSLPSDLLRFDGHLPGFRLKETRGSEMPVNPIIGFGFILPESRLTFSPNAVKAECTCGGELCVHVLATLDTVLLWLRQPWTKAFDEALTALTTPSWERTLRALDLAVKEESFEKAEIFWRLRIFEDQWVELSPYVVRKNKKGQRNRGTKLTRRKLMQDYAGQLSATDARVMALLPDHSSAATRSVLFELVDHPNVQLEWAPERSVRIERAKVGLVAEDRSGVVVVTAGIDGTALPASLIERLQWTDPDDPIFHWDEPAAKLTVLDVRSEIVSLMRVLAEHDNAFPPESHPALLEKLSTLSQRVPVAMPRSVMGESVPTLNLPVVRLEAQPGGRVRVELRTRPLPDGPSFIPGEGARDVHVRRGTGAVHAVRDFAQESAKVAALQTQLSLESADSLLEDAEGALALLAACKEMKPSPELEWLGTPLRLLSNRGAPALKVAVERKRDWFGLLGGLSVEGERVELARLLDAARRQKRFVQVRGNDYVEIEDALRKHLERLSDHAHTSRHGLEIGPAAAEVINSLEQAGVDVKSDKAWQSLVERIFAAKELKPRVPGGLKTQLRDYQLEGFRWLTRLASWGAGGVLADDMGLGKTVQALAVLLDRSRLGPALVLAPTSVAFNWMDEAKRFAPSLKMKLFAESEDRGQTLETLGPKDVLVLSYGLLTRDIERLSALRFSTIVFDEGQTLKNALTHRARAARSLQGDFKIVLSGTPLENHLGELWSLFAIVFPGLLGSWESFRLRFANPIEKGVDPTAAPALARVLQPFLLRRTKAQVETQLPPRTDIRVPVILSPAEWTLYEDARLAALSALETRKDVLREQERRIEVLAALTRLRLLASHPRLYDASSKLESAKLERFMELVNELVAEGHRALVFSQFTSHLTLVREVLDAQGITYEYLDGQTPQGARAERVRAFQEGKAPLFLISLKAGGFGLNLTAATSVIHLDPWWNPAVEDQASDRAHRIGQTRPVTVYRLVARGTIEEQMLELHEHKRSLVAGVLEGKEQAGKLSTQELLGLLSQRLAPMGDVEGSA